METLHFFYVDEDIEIHPLCTVPRELANDVIEAVKDIAAKSSGPTRSKPLEVVEVDQDHYKPFRINPKRGAKAASDLPAPRVFQSAREASTHIGCTHNEVAMALGAARRRGETTAKIRGVTFRYIEDAPDAPD